MIVRIADVDFHPGLYSYTRDIGGIQECIDSGLNVLLHVGSICTLYFLDGAIKTVSFRVDEAQLGFLNRFTDGDVVEINEYGTIQSRYAKEDGDCTIYTSSQCNSNCIMCPISEGQRRTEELENIDSLLEFLRYLPSDVEHITITGGEPFLLGRRIFDILLYLKQNISNAQVLLLTNGRIFADKSYAKQYTEARPKLCVPGIPIHGSTADRHDAITQAKGSFQQTVLGIRHLLNHGEYVEIRIVVSKLNQDDIGAIAEMIIEELPGVGSVKIMGLEMLGSAAMHCDQVWIDYDRAMQASEEAAEILLSHGIDVELYNFPLCVVKRKYWGIYRKSIDPYKIRFTDKCEQCEEKENCGGIFSGTIRLIDNVDPFVKNMVVC